MVDFANKKRPRPEYAAWTSVCGIRKKSRVCGSGHEQKYRNRCNPGQERDDDRPNLHGLKVNEETHIGKGRSKNNGGHYLQALELRDQGKRRRQRGETQDDDKRRQHGNEVTPSFYKTLFF